MPSWIVAAVFKTTISLLANRGRDVLAEKLRHGDIVDQRFRHLIVREITDIRSKLDASAKKDLKASLSFFKEGIAFMYQVFDQTASGEHGEGTSRRPRTEQEKLAVNLKSSTGGLNASANAVYFVKGLESVNLADLDESAKRSLSYAKKRFDEARIAATGAFNDESLKMSDRIIAKKVRVMATLLHEIDNHARALAVCRVSLEELHAVSTVQHSFNFREDYFRSLFYQSVKPIKDEREEIVADVCHVNRVLYSVTNIVGKGGSDLFDWPSINVGHQNVDPLRDHRVAKILRELNVEHYCLVSSFGNKASTFQSSEKIKDGERSEPRGEWGEQKGKGTLFSPFPSWLAPLADWSRNFVSRVPLLAKKERLTRTSFGNEASTFQSREKRETRGKDGEQSEPRGEMGEQKGKGTFSSPFPSWLAPLADWSRSFVPRVPLLAKKERSRWFGRLFPRPLTRTSFGNEASTLQSSEKRETRGKDGERSEPRGEWGEQEGKRTLSSLFLSWLAPLADWCRNFVTRVPLRAKKEHAGYKEGEEEYSLTRPWDIATNTQSQLIVADKGSNLGGNVKVFNINGKFQYSLSPPHDDGDKGLMFLPLSVATDREDNVFVLAELVRGYAVEKQCLYVFDKHANLTCKFPLRKGARGSRMTVSDPHHQVSVLVTHNNKYQVEVYEADGRFVRSFGEEILKEARDITAANNGQVMVLDVAYMPGKNGPGTRLVGSKRVHVFSAQGEHLREFTVQGRNNGNGRMTFHQASEHVILSSRNPDTGPRGQVSIYFKNGKLLRSIQLDTEKNPSLRGVAVTVDGRIAVTSYKEGKVYVV